MSEAGPTIVAFSGWAGSGKSTCAELVQIEYGYSRLSFATPVKELALACGWNGEKDDAGRKFLQNLGVGARQVLGPDVWVNAALCSMRRNRRYVIDDCRFVNECRMVTEMGGVIVRVNRPGVVPARSHLSETQLDSYPFDFVIDNSGTEFDLLRSTRRLMDHLLGLATVIPFPERTPA